MQTHLHPMGMVIWVDDSNSFAFDDYDDGDDNVDGNNIVCHSKFSQQSRNNKSEHSIEKYINGNGERHEECERKWEEIGGEGE